MSQKEIRFSQHALEKFDLLAERGFKTDQATVNKTILEPDAVMSNQDVLIAHRIISDALILRVIYTETVDEYFVITFYPGSRKRYEDKI